jgi:hypothetical protein
MMKRTALIMVSVFCFVSTAIFSQEAAQEVAVDENKIVYYIRTINFEIIGHTRKFALLHLLDLEEGQKITGRDSLESLISRKTQDLRNERVLKDEETRIDYTIAEAGEDGLVPVDLLVHTEDSWNIIALPQPRFTSGSGDSDGFKLAIKARDYNFLGTMKPLRVNLSFEYDSNTKAIAVPLEIDADIPFTFLEKIWYFNFDNIFTFNAKSDAPSQYTNVTGLSVELPWKQTTITTGFDQSFILNEENGDEEKKAKGIDLRDKDFFDEKWYMVTDLFARWNVPIGITVGNFGELTYNASLSENFKYRPGGDTGEYRKSPATIFSHSFGFGQIDWKGNFLKGLSVSVSNSISFNEYNLTRGNGARKDDWDISLGSDVIGHFLPVNFFGIYGRLNYTLLFNTKDTPVQLWGMRAGTNLRGIPDDKLGARQVLSFNLELPLRILPFNPAQWFESRYFKPFELEFHFSPFLDLALIDGSERNADVDYRFNIRDLLATAGIEIYVYSLSWRSLYLRGSIGWDLRKWHDTGNMPGAEFFFGMERFF